jgi:Fe-S cluster biogenesis protein NfuA
VGDGAAYIRLRGACSGCGAALTTLTQLIETAVAALVPEVPRTVLVG